MPPFNAPRTKVQLKLAVNRIKLLYTKKKAVNEQLRRDIAQLLEQDKEASARIRVEHIIREDYLLEGLEQVELYCELLLARFGLLEGIQPYLGCDPGIEEAIHAILYAAGRIEGVKELLIVRDLLAPRFGRDFILAAVEDRDNIVNERLVARLNIGTPETLLVDRYLEEIARSFKIKWKSPDTITDEEDLEEASALNEPKKNVAGCAKCDAHIQNVSDTSSNNSAVKPSIVTSASEMPTLDDLAARLEALKRQ
ncbi:regulator of Vps4 activity in the MVB pathway-domain-containing protein [Syncephalis fuscata]|nr:regulator of Vps4 activity in the MVB pathway-domain-containing protein [Syncephalis fuscata]